MKRAVERRERRRQNEMLIITIRKLVRSYELAGPFARFWEGALGNASYRHLITDSLKLALDEDGYIHSGPAALNLLDAMHARDMTALAATLLKIGDEKLDMFPGVHVKYGGRVLSSMLRERVPGSTSNGLQRTKPSGQPLASRSSATLCVSDARRYRCTPLRDDPASTRTRPGITSLGTPTKLSPSAERKPPTHVSYAAFLKSRQAPLASPSGTSAAGHGIAMK